MIYFFMNGYLMKCLYIIVLEVNFILVEETRNKFI